MKNESFSRLLLVKVAIKVPLLSLKTSNRDELRREDE